MLLLKAKSCYLKATLCQKGHPSCSVLFVLAGEDSSICAGKGPWKSICPPASSPQLSQDDIILTAHVSSESWGRWQSCLPLPFSIAGETEEVIGVAVTNVLSPT